MPTEDLFELDKHSANPAVDACADLPRAVGAAELLAIPDPSGPPVPVKRHPFQFTLRSMMLGVAACGGVFYVLSQNNLSTCAGATRSSRLKWQERQLEIEAAERELQSESAGSADQLTGTADRPHNPAPSNEGEQHE